MTTNNSRWKITSNDTVGTKVQTNKVTSYYRQWNRYCFKCGVKLKNNSPGYLWKVKNHKDDSTFMDKKG